MSGSPNPFPAYTGFPSLLVGAVGQIQIANNGTAASTQTYAKSGFIFAKGAVPSTNTIAATISGTAINVQLDSKTFYVDGSTCFGYITYQVPVLAAAAIETIVLTSVTKPTTAPTPVAVSLINGQTCTLTVNPSSGTAAFTAEIFNYYGDWLNVTAISSGSIQAGMTIAGANIYSAKGATIPGLGPAGGTAFGIANGQGGVGIYPCGNAFVANQPNGSYIVLDPKPYYVAGAGTDLLVASESMTGSVPYNPITSVITQEFISQLASSTDFWRQGPLCTEARVSIPASTLGVSSMRLQADISVYADGTWHADIMFAMDSTGMNLNGVGGYPSTTGTGGLYITTIAVNGTQTFTTGGVYHPTSINWTSQQGTWINDLQVIHNPTWFMERDAMLPFDTTIGVDNSTTGPGSQHAIGSIINTTYGPFATGSLDLNMGDYGAREDVGYHHGGILAAYITQNYQHRQWATALSRCAGSIPWHYWNPTTNDWWKVNDFPVNQAVFLQGNNGGTSPDIGYTGGTLGSAWTKTNGEHPPEMTYLELLQSGERYYLDELLAQTWWTIFQGASAQFCFVGQSGMDTVPLLGATVREYGWLMRDFLLSSYITPTSHASSTMLNTVLADNIYYLNNTLIPNWSNLEYHGFLPLQYGNAGVGGLGSMGPWEQDYCATWICHAARLGVPGLNTYINWTANFYVNRFLSGSKGFSPFNGFSYGMNWFPNYNPPYPALCPNQESAYQTWAELYWHTIVGSGPHSDGPNAVILYGGALATGPDSQYSFWDPNNTLTVNTAHAVAYDSGFAHELGDYASLAYGTLQNYQSLGCPGITPILPFLLNLGAQYVAIALTAGAEPQYPAYNFQPITVSGDYFFNGTAVTWTFVPNSTAVDPLDWSLIQKYIVNLPRRSTRPTRNRR